MGASRKIIAPPENTPPPGQAPCPTGILIRGHSNGKMCTKLDGNTHRSGVTAEAPCSLPGHPRLHDPTLRFILACKRGRCSRTRTTVAWKFIRRKPRPSSRRRSVHLYGDSRPQELVDGCDVAAVKIPHRGEELGDSKQDREQSSPRQQPDLLSAKFRGERVRLLLSGVVGNIITASCVRSLYRYGPCLLFYRRRDSSDG